MVAVFNSMTFALKVTPLAVRSLSEGAVAVKRFQVTNIDKPVYHPQSESPKFPFPHTNIAGIPILSHC